MVHQISNCHIHAVVNNLKFVILDYLAAKISGILDWPEISVTGPLAVTKICYRVHYTQG